MAVIDGDIVYGAVDDLHAHAVDPSNKRDLAERAFSGSTPWPFSIVTYKYDSDATEAAISGSVNEAIRRWKDSASYITFWPVANSAAPENGVLMITNTCDGCHANYGYDKDAPRWMNLDQTCDNCYADAATHELGHVLGTALPLCHHYFP